MVRALHSRVELQLGTRGWEQHGRMEERPYIRMVDYFDPLSTES